MFYYGGFLMMQNCVLSVVVLLLIQKNNIWVSSATAWEIATKYRIGKLPEAKYLLENYVSVLNTLGFIELPINTNHALTAGSLTIDHRDPFDRMLMAQAQLEQLPVITYDPAFYLLDIQIIPT
jgi:PIN domain nuclease of toxin-antitoxin system